MCDHVPDVYQATFGDYADMFVNLFPELDWTFYDVCNGQFPQDLTACDVYFATGSRYSVYDDHDWIKELKATVRIIAQLNKYLVGFCFGHQLIGAALGGKVAKSPYGWRVGVHKFQVSATQKWMQPFQNPFQVLMMCQDQILGLPDNAVVLASHPKCPVGMIQVGEKILGIQGHPEFSKAYDRVLIENRVAIMGADVVEAGLKSLEQDVHQKALRAWVLRFLKA